MMVKTIQRSDPKRIWRDKEGGRGAVHQMNFIVDV